MSMKASVVINTYNRGPYIGAAIRSIATQSFEDVELVIVNGPSTDNTEEVLDSLAREGYRFKLRSCASRNLSESRNIGIAASAGDVVMFIDDDAIAHPRWVERLMAPYAERDVAAVGGFTIDHTGMGFQCRYTICDRMGNAQYTSQIDPEQLLNAGVGFAFPSLLGTNSSFRRMELLRIGGFDEVFAYMLDETDVCARIFDRGKRIVTVPNAYVLHKYAPSHTRTAARMPNSLLAPARSKCYFVLKHGRRVNLSMTEMIEEINRYRKDIEFSNRWFLDHKKIGAAHYDKLMSELAAGVAEGLALGTDLARHELVSPHIHSADVELEFVRLRTDTRFKTHSDSLRIYFVAQGYPPADTAGIARWTYECATGLAERGHEVHVVTRSPTDSSYVDVVSGVWVHFVTDTADNDALRLPPINLPGSILRRAEAVVTEIARAKAIWGVDIISAPIWDLEGILCIRSLGVPVVTSLHTTYQLALPYKPQWRADATYRRKHVDLIIEGERWLLANSACVLANSNEIVREIDSAYGVSLAESAVPLKVVPHGVGLPVHADEMSQVVENNVLQLLFVGRLEERKGPDTLAAALGALPTDIPAMEVLLVGQSPGDLDPFVIKLKAALDTAQSRLPQLSIRTLGYVDDETLQRCYAACDVFVAPSRFESFGLILVEAMRWGKPVIAGNIGGMRDVIEEGVTGRLFEVGNAAELAQVIVTLVRDKSERTRLGDNGRASYLRHFTREAMAQGIEIFLAEQALKGSR